MLLSYSFCSSAAAELDPTPASRLFWVSFLASFVCLWMLSKALTAVLVSLVVAVAVLRRLAVLQVLVVVVVVLRLQPQPQQWALHSFIVTRRRLLGMFYVVYIYVCVCAYAWYLCLFCYFRRSTWMLARARPSRTCAVSDSPPCCSYLCCFWAHLLAQMSA